MEALCEKVATAGRLSIDLSGRPSARQVRTTVTENLLFGAPPAHRYGGVLLVVDELVGNAYRHAGEPRELRVVRRGDSVLVEVTDTSPVALTIQEQRLAPRGHGLRLVNELATEWGARADDRGKVVWALVPAHLYPAG
ncbi:ATP-binding protein [Amycolatopsis sp. OK19-0408]|uniref:ATP-binding protein n=1 Tax=Amycolatopsis iheyensis TaxID=2945988 RepID=A0A9X2SRW2_9PSEU|nr:ATP-binding protein [Amycolatopsis iheyensis]MCR6490855.1 ATP-binding protein [Amycolatopsis iheyensis]